MTTIRRPIRGDLVVAVYLDTWCRDLACTVRIAITSGNREYVATMMWEYYAVFTCRFSRLVCRTSLQQIRGLCINKNMPILSSLLQAQMTMVLQQLNYSSQQV